MLAVRCETRADFTYPRELMRPIYETVTRTSGFSYYFENPNEITLKAMAETEEIQDRPGQADLDSFLDALGHDEGV